MRRVVKWSFLALLLVAGIYSASVILRVEFPTSWDRVPKWIADLSDRIDADFGLDGQANPLAETVGVERYTIRPPKGYSLVQPASSLPPEIKKFVWAGERRDDGTRGMVTLLLIPLPPEEAGANVLESQLATALADRQDKFDNWTQTEPERVQVNGLQFLRARWKGFDRARQRMRHGFHYMAQDGRTIICLGSIDVEPHDQRGLEVAEAAILTFRKK